MLKPPTVAAAGVSKMECLDSVRGLAALGVVLAHLMLTFWPGLYFRSGPAWDQAPVWVQVIYRFPGKFLVNGHLIVPAFYVLSGFVLSLTFFRNGGPASLRSAATRRYFRLMFPVAASIMLAYVLMMSGAMRNQAAVQILDEIYGISEANKIASAPGASNRWLAGYYDFSPSLPAALREATWGAFTGPSQYNRVLYTMPDELAGSFLVFGFLALFGNCRNRWLLYGVVGGACFLEARLNLLDFVVGMALCDLWKQNQQTRRIELPLAWALAFVAVAVFLISGPIRCQSYLLVAAVVASPSLQRVLSASWLTWLGRTSFGLFTLHMPILCSLGCGLYLFLLRTLTWSHAAASVTAALLSLLVSLLAGWAFYHAVDGPTLSLVRRFDDWLFRPRPTTVPAAPAVPDSRAA
jgi:peptidoglycan/LPS O-acetylase OafA/YrhL